MKLQFVVWKLIYRLSIITNQKHEIKAHDRKKRRQHLMFSWSAGYVEALPEFKWTN